MAILDESQALNVFTPDLKAGINARVHQANCEGGLGTSGAELQIDFCDSKFDPNQAQACARRLTSGDYVASVGNNLSEAGIPTLLAKDKIANVPSIGLDGSNFTAATSFNVDDGSLVAAGLAVMACKAEGKRINEIRLASPITQEITKTENAALDANGCAKIGKSVDLPGTATDVSSEVTTAAKDADAVVLVMGGQNAAQVLKARQQLDIKTPFAISCSQASAANLKSFGSAAEGALVGGCFAPQDVASAGEKRFRADMAAIGQSSQVDDNARAGWVSTDLFVTALKDTGAITRASVLAALDGVTNYNAGGMIPTVDFSKPGPDPKYPRVVNLTVTPEVVRHGTVVLLPGQPTFIPIRVQ